MPEIPRRCFQSIKKSITQICILYYNFSDHKMILARNGHSVSFVATMLTENLLYWTSFITEKFVYKDHDWHI